MPAISTMPILTPVPANPPLPSVQPLVPVPMTLPLITSLGNLGFPNGTVSLLTPPLFKFFFHRITGQQLSKDGLRGLGRSTGLKAQVPSAVQHTRQTHERLLVRSLADVDKDGQLRAEEFILAMHLIDMAKTGHPLPLSLPQDLIPPSLRGGIKSSELVNGTGPYISPGLMDTTEIEPAQKNKNSGTALMTLHVLLSCLHWSHYLSRPTRLSVAKQEMERQRREEWERAKKEELGRRKEAEQAEISRLRAKKKSLELELEAVGNKHKQISDRLRDAQSKRRIQKAEVDLINQKRDARIAEINTLQLEFEVQTFLWPLPNLLLHFYGQ
ncbi:hypothetical protein GOODEAATRI_005291 [Goodea atripinnis]|uniref:Intersectin 1 n=1 Tax=Goodea atripinnis TaxID=208336 RepID=A0ABV0N837_9TELE